MTDKFIEEYKMFLNWGLDSQVRMCIEEMSELTKELCKVQRYWDTDKQKNIDDNIREELADVLNMAEQLEYYFGVDEIEKIRKQKIDRSLKRDF